MSGTQPCQISFVYSGSSMRSVSRSPRPSKRQTSTLVALAEKREKLTPLPSQVAPRGCGSPSRTRGRAATRERRASAMPYGRRDARRFDHGRRRLGRKSRAALAKLGVDMITTRPEYSKPDITLHDFPKSLQRAGSWQDNLDSGRAIIDRQPAAFEDDIVYLPESVGRSRVEHQERRADFRFGGEPPVRRRVEQRTGLDDLAPREVERLRREFQSASDPRIISRIGFPQLRPRVLLPPKDISEQQMLVRVECRHEHQAPCRVHQRRRVIADRDAGRRRSDVD